MSEEVIPAEATETPGAVPAPAAEVGVVVTPEAVAVAAEPEVEVIPPGWSLLTWQGDTKHYRYEAEEEVFLFTYGVPLAVPDAVVAALEALPWSLSHFFSKE